METEYRIQECVPKGGMCRTCKEVNDDCSELDFESMPIISIGLEEIISSYNKRNYRSENSHPIQ